MVKQYRVSTQCTSVYIRPKPCKLVGHSAAKLARITAEYKWKTQFVVMFGTKQEQGALELQCIKVQLYQ